jgi:hypothetical protein
MWCRRISRLAVLAAALGLTVSLAVFAQSSSHRGRKYKAPPPTSRIQVTILRNDDAKPIENASVIFQVKGDKGNMELKTNEDGKSVIDVLPTGSDVLLQVIAKGYQTYGESYKVDKSDMAIEVKLKRPGQQYSVYKLHDQTADAGKSTNEDKTSNTTTDAAPKDSSQKDSGAKDSGKDKPSNSANQDGAKPANSEPQPQ